MKGLVVYDSNFGNTKKLAELIVQELGKDTRVVKVDEVTNRDIEGVDLIVVGSPIVAWRPTEKINRFLNGLKSDSLKGIKAAAFDTRIKVWFSGNAAKKIALKLEGAGAKLVAETEWFFVAGKEGPLVWGEEKKAMRWAKKIKQASGRIK